MPLTETVTGFHSPNPPKSDKYLALKWLYSFVIPHKKRISLLWLLSITASLLVLVQPYLTKKLIDDALLEKNFALLLMFSLLIFAIGLASTLLAGFNRILHSTLSGKILFSLRESVYDHLQRLSPNFYIHQRTGDLLSRMNGDIAEIQRFSVDSLFSSVSGTLGLIGSVTMMFILEHHLACLLFVLIPLEWFFLRYMRPRVEKQTRLLRERTADISSFLTETIPSMKFIQTVASEKRELKNLKNLNKSFLFNLIKLQKVEFITSAIPSTMTSITRTVVFLIGGYWVIEEKLALGSFIAFSTYLGMAIGPVQTLLGIYIAWQRMMVSLERVKELTDHKADVNQNLEGCSDVAVQGEIKFNRVSFHYPGDRKIIFKDATCRLPAHKKIGFYGPSGIGKTTLIDLLVRHFNPQQGRILIDGRDIATLNVKTWRRKIALVSHDVVLFKASIADNIRYIKPQATDEAVINAIRQANLQPFIDTLPQGIETQIGERGCGLSSGQKQRVSIARAILQNPSIIIFDEATSGIDFNTEKRILAEIDSLFFNKTRIIVSHRSMPAKDIDYFLTIRNCKLELHSNTKTISKEYG